MREKAYAWKYTLIILVGSVVSNLAAELLADDVRALLIACSTGIHTLLQTIIP